MYIPPIFQEDRLDVLHAFIRQHGFAMLISGGVERIASHLPVLLDAQRGDQGMLRGHMARQNPHWKTFGSGGEALMIFHGPHAYISPTWYVSPLKVPTWNYTAVHAYGIPTVVDGPALHSILEDTVNAYESMRPKPWSMDKLPVELVTKLEDAVVGFEMEIIRLEGKWKLGQNHSGDDRQGAIEGLLQTGDPASIEVAELMRRRAFKIE